MDDKLNGLSAFDTGPVFEWGASAEDAVSDFWKDDRPLVPFSDVMAASSGSVLDVSPEGTGSEDMMKLDPDDAFDPDTGEIRYLNVFGKRMTRDRLAATDAGRKLLDVVRKNREGRKGFFEALVAGGLAKLFPYVNDVVSVGLSIKDTVALRKTFGKIANREAVSDDELVASRYFLASSERDQAQGVWGMVGGIMGAAPAFALEFFTSAGIGTALKKGLAKLLKREVVEEVTEAGLRTAIRKFSKSGALGAADKVSRSSIVEFAKKSSIDDVVRFMAKPDGLADDALKGLMRSLDESAMALAKAAADVPEAAAVNAARAKVARTALGEMQLLDAGFRQRIAARASQATRDVFLNQLDPAKELPSRIRDSLADAAEVMYKASLTGAGMLALDEVAHAVVAPVMGVDRVVTPGEMSLAAAGAMQQDPGLVDRARLLALGSRWAEYMSESTGKALTLVGGTVGRKLATGSAGKFVKSSRLGTYVTKNIDEIKTGARIRTELASLVSAGEIKDNLAAKTRDIAERAVRNRIGSEAWDALGKAAQDEAVSRAHGVVDGLMVKIASGRAFLGWMIDKGIGPKEIAKKLADVGYDGVVEEMFEERVSGFVSGLLGLDGEPSKGLMDRMKSAAKGMWWENPDQFFAELVAFAIPAYGHRAAMHAQASLLAGGFGKIRDSMNRYDNALSQAAAGASVVLDDGGMSEIVRVGQAEGQKEAVASQVREKASVPPVKTEGTEVTAGDVSAALGSSDSLSESLAEVAKMVEDVRTGSMSQGRKFLSHAIGVINAWSAGNPALAMVRPVDAALRDRDPGAANLVAQMGAEYRAMLRAKVGQLWQGKGDVSNAPSKAYDQAREAIESDFQRRAKELVQGHMASRGVVYVTAADVEANAKAILASRKDAPQEGTDEYKAALKLEAGNFTNALRDRASNEMRYFRQGERVILSQSLGSALGGSAASEAAANFMVSKRNVLVNVAVDRALNTDGESVAIGSVNLSETEMPLIRKVAGQAEGSAPDAEGDLMRLASLLRTGRDHGLSEEESIRKTRSVARMLVAGSDLLSKGTVSVEGASGRAAQLVLGQAKGTVPPSYHFSESSLGYADSNAMAKSYASVADALSALAEETGEAWRERGNKLFLEPNTNYFSEDPVDLLVRYWDYARDKAGAAEDKFTSLFRGFDAADPDSVDKLYEKHERFKRYAADAEAGRHEDKDLYSTKNVRELVEDLGGIPGIDNVSEGADGLVSAPVREVVAKAAASALAEYRDAVGQRLVSAGLSQSMNELTGRMAWHAAQGAFVDNRGNVHVTVAGIRSKASMVEDFVESLIHGSRHLVATPGLGYREAAMAMVLETRAALNAVAARIPDGTSDLRRSYDAMTRLFSSDTYNIEAVSKMVSAFVFGNKDPFATGYAALGLVAHEVRMKPAFAPFVAMVNALAGGTSVAPGTFGNFDALDRLAVAWGEGDGSETIKTVKSAADNYARQLTSSLAGGNVAPGAEYDLWNSVAKGVLTRMGSNAKETGTGAPKPIVDTTPQAVATAVPVVEAPLDPSEHRSPDTSLIIPPGRAGAGKSLKERFGKRNSKTEKGSAEAGSSKPKDVSRSLLLKMLNGSTDQVSTMVSALHVLVSKLPDSHPAKRAYRETNGTIYPVNVMEGGAVFPGEDEMVKLLVAFDPDVVTGTDAVANSIMDKLQGLASGIAAKMRFVEEKDYDDDPSSMMLRDGLVEVFAVVANAASPARFSARPLGKLITDTREASYGIPEFEILDPSKPIPAVSAITDLAQYRELAAKLLDSKKPDLVSLGAMLSALGPAAGRNLLAKVRSTTVSGVSVLTPAKDPGDRQDVAIFVDENYADDANPALEFSQLAAPLPPNVSSEALRFASMEIVNIIRPKVGQDAPVSEWLRPVDMAAEGARAAGELRAWAKGKNDAVEAAVADFSGLPAGAADYAPRIEALAKVFDAFFGTTENSVSEGLRDPRAITQMVRGRVNPYSIAKGNKLESQLFADFLKAEDKNTAIGAVREAVKAIESSVSVLAGDLAANSEDYYDEDGFVSEMAYLASRTTADVVGRAMFGYGAFATQDMPVNTGALTQFLAQVYASYPSDYSVVRPAGKESKSVSGLHAGSPVALRGLSAMLGSDFEMAVRRGTYPDGTPVVSTLSHVRDGKTTRADVTAETYHWHAQEAWRNAAAGSFPTSDDAPYVPMLWNVGDSGRTALLNIPWEVAKKLVATWDETVGKLLPGEKAAFEAGISSSGNLMYEKAFQALAWSNPLLNVSLKRMKLTASSLQDVPIPSESTQVVMVPLNRATLAEAKLLAEAVNGSSVVAGSGSLPTGASTEQKIDKYHYFGLNRLTAFVGKGTQEQAIKGKGFRHDYALKLEEASGRSVQVGGLDYYKENPWFGTSSVWVVKKDGRPVEAGELLYEALKDEPAGKVSVDKVKKALGVTNDEVMVARHDASGRVFAREAVSFADAFPGVEGGLEVLDPGGGLDKFLALRYDFDQTFAKRAATVGGPNKAEASEAPAPVTQLQSILVRSSGDANSAAYDKAESGLVAFLQKVAEDTVSEYLSKGDATEAMATVLEALDPTTSAMLRQFFVNPNDRHVRARVSQVLVSRVAGAMHEKTLGAWTVDTSPQAMLDPGMAFELDGSTWRVKTLSQAERDPLSSHSEIYSTDESDRLWKLMNHGTANAEASVASRFNAKRRVTFQRTNVTHDWDRWGLAVNLSAEITRDGKSTILSTLPPDGVREYLHGVFSAMASASEENYLSIVRGTVAPLFQTLDGNSLFADADGVPVGAQEFGQMSQEEKDSLYMDLVSFDDLLVRNASGLLVFDQTALEDGDRGVVVGGVRVPLLGGSLFVGSRIPGGRPESRDLRRKTAPVTSVVPLESDTRKMVSKSGAVVVVPDKRASRPADDNPEQVTPETMAISGNDVDGDKTFNGYYTVHPSNGRIMRSAQYGTTDATKAYQEWRGAGYSDAEAMRLAEAPLTNVKALLEFEAMANLPTDLHGPFKAPAGYDAKTQRRVYIGTENTQPTSAKWYPSSYGARFDAAAPAEDSDPGYTSADMAAVATTYRTLLGISDSEIQRDATSLSDLAAQKIAAMANKDLKVGGIADGLLIRRLPRLLHRPLAKLAPHRSADTARYQDNLQRAGGTREMSVAFMNTIHMLQDHGMWDYARSGKGGPARRLPRDSWNVVSLWAYRLAQATFDEANGGMANADLSREQLSDYYNLILMRDWRSEAELLAFHDIWMAFNSSPEAKMRAVRARARKEYDREANAMAAEQGTKTEAYYKAVSDTSAAGRRALGLTALTSAFRKYPKSAADYATVRSRFEKASESVAKAFLSAGVSVPESLSTAAAKSYLILESARKLYAGTIETGPAGRKYQEVYEEAAAKDVAYDVAGRPGTSFMRSFPDFVEEYARLVDAYAAASMVPKRLRGLLRGEKEGTSGASVEIEARVGLREISIIGDAVLHALYADKSLRNNAFVNGINMRGRDIKGGLFISSPPKPATGNVDTPDYGAVYRGAEAIRKRPGSIELTVMLTPDAVSASKKSKPVERKLTLSGDEAVRLLLFTSVVRSRDVSHKAGIRSGIAALAPMLYKEFSDRRTAMAMASVDAEASVPKRLFDAALFRYGTSYDASAAIEDAAKAKREGKDWAYWSIPVKAGARKYSRLDYEPRDLGAPIPMNDGSDGSIRVLYSRDREEHALVPGKYLEGLSVPAVFDHRPDSGRFPTDEDLEGWFDPTSAALPNISAEEVEIPSFASAMKSASERPKPEEPETAIGPSMMEKAKAFLTEEVRLANRAAAANKNTRSLLLASPNYGAAPADASEDHSRWSGAADRKNRGFSVAVDGAGKPVSLTAVIPQYLGYYSGKDMKFLADAGTEVHESVIGAFSNRDGSSLKGHERELYDALDERFPAERFSVADEVTATVGGLRGRADLVILEKSSGTLHLVDVKSLGSRKRTPSDVVPEGIRPDAQTKALQAEVQLMALRMMFGAKYKVSDNLTVAYYGESDEPVSRLRTFTVPAVLNNPKDSLHKAAAFARLLVDFHSKVDLDAEGNDARNQALALLDARAGEYGWNPTDDIPGFTPEKAASDITSLQNTVRDADAGAVLSLARRLKRMREADSQSKDNLLVAAELLGAVHASMQRLVVENRLNQDATEFARQALSSSFLWWSVPRSSRQDDIAAFGQGVGGFFKNMNILHEGLQSKLDAGKTNSQLSLMRAYLAYAGMANAVLTRTWMNSPSTWLSLKSGTPLDNASFDFYSYLRDVSMPQVVGDDLVPKWTVRFAGDADYFATSILPSFRGVDLREIVGNKDLEALAVRYHNIRVDMDKYQGLDTIGYLSDLYEAEALFDMEGKVLPEGQRPVTTRHGRVNTGSRAAGKHSLSRRQTELLHWLMGAGALAAYGGDRMLTDIKGVTASDYYVMGPDGKFVPSIPPSGYFRGISPEAVSEAKAAAPLSRAAEVVPGSTGHRINGLMLLRERIAAVIPVALQEQAVDAVERALDVARDLVASVEGPKKRDAFEQAFLYELENAKWAVSRRSSSGELAMADFTIPFSVGDAALESDVDLVGKIKASGRDLSRMKVGGANGLGARTRQVLSDLHREASASMSIFTTSSDYIRFFGAGSMPYLQGSGMYRLYNEAKYGRRILDLPEAVEKEAKSYEMTVEGGRGDRLLSMSAMPDRMVLWFMDLFDVHASPDGKALSASEVWTGLQRGDYSAYGVPKNGTMRDFADALNHKSLARLQEIAITTDETLQDPRQSADAVRYAAIARAYDEAARKHGWTNVRLAGMTPEDLYRVHGILPMNVGGSGLVGHWVDKIVSGTKFAAGLNLSLLAQDGAGAPLVYAKPGPAEDAFVSEGMWEMLARWWSETSGHAYDPEKSGRENASAIYDAIEATSGTQDGAGIVSFKRNNGQPDKVFQIRETSLRAVPKYMARMNTPGGDGSILGQIMEGGDNAGWVRHLFDLVTDSPDPSYLGAVADWIITRTKAAAMMLSFFHLVATGPESVGAAVGLLKANIGIVSPGMLRALGGTKVGEALGITPDSKGINEFVRMLHGHDDPYLNHLRETSASAGMTWAHRSSDPLDTQRSKLRKDVASLERWAKANGFDLGEEKSKALSGLLFAMTEDNMEWTFEYVANAAKLTVFAHVMSKLRMQAIEEGRWFDPVREMRKWSNYINAEVGGIDPVTYPWSTRQGRELLNRGMFSWQWTFGAWEAGGMGVLTKKLFGNRLHPDVQAAMGMRWLRMAGGIMYGVPILFNAVIHAFGKAAGYVDDDDELWSWNNETGRTTSFNVTPLLRAMADVPGALWVKENVPLVGNLIPARAGMDDTRGNRKYYMHFGKQGWEILRWFTNPIESLCGKSSLPVQRTFEMLAGGELNSKFDLPFKGKDFLDGFWDWSKHLGGIFLPFSSSSMLNNPDAGFLNMVGPIQKGMSYSAAREEVTKALMRWADSTAYNKLWTSPAMWTDTQNLTRDWLNAARENGHNPETVLKDGAGPVMTELYRRMYAALPRRKNQKVDMAEVEKAARGLHRIRFVYGNLMKSIEARDKANSDKIDVDIDVKKARDEAIRQSFWSPDGEAYDQEAYRRFFPRSKKDVSNASDGGSVTGLLATDELPKSVLGYEVVPESRLSDEDLDYFSGNPDIGGFFDRSPDPKGTSGASISVTKFLDSDIIPESVLGYRVIGPDELSETDLAYFLEYPEAAGFFDNDDTQGSLRTQSASEGGWYGEGQENEANEYGPGLKSQPNPAAVAVGTAARRIGATWENTARAVMSSDANLVGKVGQAVASVVPATAATLAHATGFPPEAVFGIEGAARAVVNAPTTLLNKWTGKAFAPMSPGRVVDEREFGDKELAEMRGYYDRMPEGYRSSLVTTKPPKGPSEQAYLPDRELPTEGKSQGWGLGAAMSKPISDAFRNADGTGGGGLYQSMGKFHVATEGGRAVATDLTDYEFGKGTLVKAFLPTSGEFNAATGKVEGGNPVDTFNKVRVDLGPAKRKEP